MKYIAQSKLEDYKGSLVYMKPEKFLELSAKRDIKVGRFEKSAYSKKSLDNLQRRMLEELEIDPPKLKVDIETKYVVDHSGRHRAFTAYQLGIKKIPVFIKYVKHRKTIAGRIYQMEIQKIPIVSELKPEIKIRPWEVKFE